MKDKFEEKWKAFCDFDRSKYDEIRELFYFPKQDFFLLKNSGIFVQLRITNEELKKKMISISTVHGKKDENSN